MPPSRLGKAREEVHEAERIIQVSDRIEEPRVAFLH